MLKLNWVAPCSRGTNERKAERGWGRAKGVSHRNSLTPPAGLFRRATGTPRKHPSAPRVTQPSRGPSSGLPPKRKAPGCTAPVLRDTLFFLDISASLGSLTPHNSSPHTCWCSHRRLSWPRPSVLADLQPPLIQGTQWKGCSGVLSPDLKRTRGFPFLL